ncbi:MAG: hypothetical protein ACFCGT_20770 [Sandaracinaceae bacterium]
MAADPLGGRRSPLAGQLTVLILFLALAAIGVATVLLPELRDDERPEPSEAAEPGSSNDGPAAP